MALRIGAAIRGHVADCLLQHEALALAGRCTAGQGQRDGGTDRRMPGEGQFLARGEDTHTVVRVAAPRFGDEDRLGQVELTGDGLHGNRIEIIRAKDHSQRITR